MKDTNDLRAEHYESSIILCIDFLKENFEYQEAFAELKSCFQDDADRPEFDAFVKKLLPFLSKLGFTTPKISSYLDGLYSLRTKDRKRAEGLLELFDPEKENRELYESLLSWKEFHLPKGVIQILPENKCEDYHLPEAPFKRVSNAFEGLLPYQRLLLIDLRVKKGELEEEFSNFIDIVHLLQREALQVNTDHPELDKRHMKAYSSWEIDKTRERKEAWQQLKIWKLRKKYMGFKEIAEELNIKADTAKHAFYKAYERSQNKKYFPDVLRKKFSKVSRTSLDIICASCPNKGDSLNLDCFTTCPGALRYIKQDQVELNWREKPLSKLVARENYDDFLDHLQYKNSI